MKKKNLSRREVVQTLALSPLGIYLTAKMSGFIFIANTLASDLFNESLLEYKLVNISMNGGGARYYWDLPLKPNGASDYLEFNPCCITKFGSNPTGDGIYDITKVQDYWMPSIWNSNIPTPSGSTSMKNTADNMLIIRGAFLPQGGHTFGRQSQMKPIAGKSLLGSIADVSNRPIAGVTIGTDASFFTSKLGLTPISANVTASDPLRRVLDAFISNSNSRTAVNAQIEAGIDTALDLMKTESESKHRFLPTTYQDRVNAKKLMKKEFGDLEGAFNQGKTKYDNLIQKALHDPSFHVAGVEDRAIVGDGSNSFNVGRRFGAPGFIYYKGQDLREMYENCHLDLFGNYLSIAEYMITEGLTNTFSASMSDLFNISFKNLVDGNGNGNYSGTANLNFDNHDTGSHVALLMYTKMYKALSACSYELSNVFKSKSNNGTTLFDKTLITLTGDFNRQPRRDGTGSDHGSDGTNYTILSGMVPKLTVIGNTTQYKQSNSLWNKWGGSWGVAAPLSEIGDKVINFGNIASTVATMTETQTLAPNEQSLVRKVDGKVESIASNPKNIEN